MHTLRFGNKVMTLDAPRVMGIVNCTPDSFYDGGLHGEASGQIQHARRLLRAGADIIDLGGASTRPGAPAVAPEEEWRRIAPVLEGLLNEAPDTIVSVDTFHADVARRALNGGALMINDVTGGNGDPGMWPVVAEAGVPYVLMHMQGTPQTMQQNPSYSDGVVPAVFQQLLHRIAAAREAGLSDVVADVGFGFGKTLEDNYDLLANLTAFSLLDVPVLVGVSRKSMIYKALQTDAQGALNGTTALHAWALDRGAHILRVHDAQEAVEAIALHRLLHAAQDRSGQSDHR